MAVSQAILGFGWLSGTMVLSPSVFLLFRRSGHTRSVGLLSTTVTLTPILGAIWLAMGVIDLSEFQAFSAVSLIVAPMVLLWLAVKRWPAENLLNSGSSEVFS